MERKTSMFTETETILDKIYTDKNSSYDAVKKAWATVLQKAEQEGLRPESIQLNPILEIIKNIAVRSTVVGAYSELKSGTSGTRSIIGQNYTVNNFRRVISAYLDIALSDEKLLNYQGKDQSYAEIFFGAGVKAADIARKGVPIFGDTRFMNEEFKRVAAIECFKRGVKVIYVKDVDGYAVPTPVGSLWAKQNDFAFTFNATPSHNKADNDGIKFNPADGGPANDFIVNVVNERIKNYLDNDNSFETDDFALGCQKHGADFIYSEFEWMSKEAAANGLYEEVTPVRLMSWYCDQARAKVDYNAIVEKVRLGELEIIHTPFYGSGNGYLKEFFKDDANLVFNGISTLNEGRQILFDGKAPRPNAVNLQKVGEKLLASDKKLTIGYLTDPDADRVMFVVIQNGVIRVIPMNEFLVAIAFYLYYVKCLRGMDNKQRTIIAKTLATSNKVLAVGQLINKLTKENRVPEFIKELIPAKSSKVQENDYIDLSPANSEFNVGFKYFHDVLASGQAILAGEESDGHSIQNWTLDKDGLMGGFMAMEMTAKLNMDLGTFLDKIDELLKAEGLPHKFVKGGEELKMPSGTNEERDNTMATYQVNLEKAFNHPGKKIKIKTDSQYLVEAEVASILTSDGVKISFTDLSNGLIRASGTEPLIKCPTEATDKAQADFIYKILLNIAQMKNIPAGDFEFQLTGDPKARVKISYSQV